MDTYIGIWPLAVLVISCFFFIREYVLYLLVEVRDLEYSLNLVGHRWLSFENVTMCAMFSQ